jgi:hypothetical protein
MSLKALRELGPRKLALFAWYKVGLKVGYFRWRTSSKISNTGIPQHLPSAIHPLFCSPDPDNIRATIGSDGLSQLIVEADEIVDGHVRLFGGQPVPLNLIPPGKLVHWTESEREQKGTGDAKFIWEPARFGWVFTLGRAYHLTGDERYPEAFWRYFERFLQANPLNYGPNWESAQEVALRLIAFIFAAQIFADSAHSTDDKKSKIAASIASHSARIPPTLIYARSQNNNHLLSEAAGLISASLALPEHPHAKRWSKLGWKWFRNGLQTQITDEGAYMQQSTNYHRLMLQLVLWVNRISGDMDASQQLVSSNLQAVIPKLQLATRWLLALTDPESGCAPNLGPNDGAYILPLTVQPFGDYRPVLQAASQVFLGQSVFEGGAWDEMSLWLIVEQASALRNHPAGVSHPTSEIATPFTLQTPHSWAYLRTVHFYDRPGHADQLHLDLWWRGLNVAQDAGTYLYNADPPWDNALTHTAVHNTVMVDNHQQMTPAGRFLYLDWAQAEILEQAQVQDGSWNRIVATHDGYQRIGMMHIRSVTANKDDRWLIEDRIQPLADDVGRALHTVRLHWLLPDWKWKIDDSSLTIEVFSPFGWIELDVCSQPPVAENPLSVVSVQLIRAGELLYGAGEISPTWGWVSPTYGVKSAALSCVVTAVAALPLTLTSEWNFPHD